MINGIGSGATSLVGTRASGVAAAPATRTGGRETSSSALSTSAAIVAEGAPIETERVAALRAAIRAGSYRADPAAIAGRMIEGDLS